MTSPAIARIKRHVAQLERSGVSQAHRFMLWRLIVDAAHEAHAAEVQQLDELKSPMADPAFEPLEPTI
jgi:hypothetical protein